MIHIVIPEGLNRLDSAVQPLSDYYEACLRRVAEMAATGEGVYLAPGNTFGHPLQRTKSLQASCGNCVRT